MKAEIEVRENWRQFEQSLLDASKSKMLRNKLGQYATPPQLATEIVENTWKYVNERSSLSVLEPACGTGAFIAAILRTKDRRKLTIQAYEIDAEVEEIARQLWQDEHSNISLADFTKQTPKDDDLVDLLITNPPYSRHHHIENSHKLSLRATAKAVTGIQPSGLAGLYCYFILISHQWLKPDAVSSWLIPTEFMDVNYGEAIKDYLLQKVSLLRIHCFDNAESLFRDALVSSAVVWFRNRLSSPTDLCECTFGRSITSPDFVRTMKHSDLTATEKWTPLFSQQRSIKIEKTAVRLSELFRISRGIATGSNAYFILNEGQIRKHKLPQDFLIPVLPSSKHIKNNIIKADQQGLPLLEKRLFLLDCDIGEDVIMEKYASLHTYLKRGKQRGLPSKYLCSRRKPWYSQESRPPAPIVFKYMGRISNRKNPFRFIRNHSLATATNVYLMLYPTRRFEELLQGDPMFLEYVWEVLNRISFSRLRREGRSYGGGLHKIEPKELGNLLLDDERLVRAFTADSSDAVRKPNPNAVQLPLFSS